MCYTYDLVGMKEYLCGEQTHPHLLNFERAANEVAKLHRDRFISGISRSCIGIWSTSRRLPIRTRTCRTCCRSVYNRKLTYASQQEKTCTPRAYLFYHGNFFYSFGSHEARACSNHHSFRFGGQVEQRLISRPLHRTADPSPPASPLQYTHTALPHSAELSAASTLIAPFCLAGLVRDVLLGPARIPSHVLELLMFCFRRRETRAR